MAVVLEQTKLIAVGSDDKTVPAFDANAASGNLVITTRSARFGASGPVPSISAPSGYTGVVPAGESNPQIPNMEAHTTGVAYAEGDGTTMGGVSWSWTGTASCTIGVHHEFSGVGASPTLDKCEAAGSSTSNVSSIATGSTGTLGASAGLAFLIGLNRSAETANSLQQDAGMTEIFDRGVTGSTVAYNEMHAWQEFSSSTAYNVTVSHSSGTSTRMGALVATFIAGGSSTQNITPTGASVSVTPGTLTVTPGAVAITPTGPTVSVSAGTLTVAQVTPISVTGPTVTATPGTLTITTGAVDVSPTGPAVTVTPGTLTITTGAVNVTPTAPAVTAAPGTLTITTGAVDVTPTAPTVTVTSGTLTVTTGAVDVSPVAPAVTVTPGTLALDLTVTLAAPTVTVTPATLTVLAATVPDAVSDLACTPGDQQVVLTWSAPGDGGAAITDYIVQYRVAP